MEINPDRLFSAGKNLNLLSLYSSRQSSHLTQLSFNVLFILFESPSCSDLKPKSIFLRKHCLCMSFFSQEHTLFPILSIFLSSSLQNTQWCDSFPKFFLLTPVIGVVNLKTFFVSSAAEISTELPLVTGIVSIEMVSFLSIEEY